MRRLRPEVVEARLAALPKPEFPPELPVCGMRGEIARAIREHQVVIVCGETGSGKTTQLPKICLELGRGVHGLIGHTQPRRIAARSVAARIAQELKHRARPGGGLQGALHRPDQSAVVREADDRRHPARRDAERSAAVGVRHADHRRGARAQPQHRFPARLPQAAPAAAAGPQGDRHLGDHQCRGVLGALRRRAGDRGVGAAVSGRGALPALRRQPRRRRPGGRHRRRDRRSGPARSRRRAGVPARRARDPRDRGGAAQASLRRAGHAAAGDPAAVRTALGAGTGARVPVDRPSPHRARDQRRRDVAHRARHPLRRRQRARAGQALQLPQQGRAAAGREGVAGRREAARRPLRPGAGRRLRPAVRRGRLQRASRVHRS